MIIFICDLILSLYISAKTIKEQLKISNALWQRCHEIGNGHLIKKTDDRSRTISTEDNFLSFKTNYTGLHKIAYF